MRNATIEVVIKKILIILDMKNHRAFGKLISIFSSLILIFMSTDLMIGQEYTQTIKGQVIDKQ